MVGDFLHIIKLARKHFIKCNITIRSTTEKVFNEIILLKKVLSLNDKSDISFMKDFYPLKIFDIAKALHFVVSFDVLASLTNIICAMIYI